MSGTRKLLLPVVTKNNAFSKRLGFVWSFKLLFKRPARVSEDPSFRGLRLRRVHESLLVFLLLLRCRSSIDRCLPNYETKINVEHLLGSVRVTIQFENVAFEQIVDINMQVIDHTRAAFIILCVITPTRVVSLLRKSIRFGPCYVIPAVTRSNLVCCNRPDLVQPLAHGLFGLAANPIAKSYG